MSGRSNRVGMTLDALYRKFSTEYKAEQWFYELRWGQTGIHCPKCGSFNILHKAKAKGMPYMCRDCRRFFSLKTGTVMEGSKISIRQWIKAAYMMTTELKGKSALKLSRDIGVTHRTAWFMTHRIRQSYSSMLDDLIAQGGFEGTTEFDETAVGGKVKSMNAKSYKSFKERGGGTGFSGKEIVIGAKNRETGKVVARVIEDRKKETLQGFVTGMTKRGSTIMTDEAKGYKQIPDRKHMSVNHSVNKFVRGMASTNGMESFWSLFKRGLDGVYHKVSPKHLARYVDEFCGRNNDRPEDTARQMELMMKAMVGQRLTYEDLIRPNGKDNFSRQTRIERERERYDRYVEMSQNNLIKDATALVAMRLKTELEEALKGLDWDEESDPNQLGLDYNSHG